MADVVTLHLTRSNAGAIVGALVAAGIHTVMRGGPRGGSVDATVIVRAQQLVLEPGDTVTVQDGTVVVIDHG